MDLWSVDFWKFQENYWLNSLKLVRLQMNSSSMICGKGDIQWKMYILFSLKFYANRNEIFPPILWQRKLIKSYNKTKILHDSWDSNSILFFIPRLHKNSWSSLSSWFVSYLPRGDSNPRLWQTSRCPVSYYRGQSTSI